MIPIRLSVRLQSHPAMTPLFDASRPLDQAPSIQQRATPAAPEEKKRNPRPVRRNATYPVGGDLPVVRVSAGGRCGITGTTVARRCT
ncbi:conserved hypothetical protein [Xanthomonas phaseoli pv. phaseoli]|uniref:Uncharacterized protein n=1 Tax=Xanthomonas campestris pv. phaseoli TaxID=317013 RepID=A0AB38DUK7_XANCH|nr:conserved hypothetical protein [Xanthomonas phaseoli pv. phaseoli]SON76070.1 conserved hypothetical protein [Xanthomonas phaseoli pv. phaseoli]SON78790.1 conserved hypothetical protein [Xanthomonas phaseoli pv. phaseoli]SOO30636.1 conserved hypothetical protein [Xanthomonas phaseoli pv. phaseoli]